MCSSPKAQSGFLNPAGASVQGRELLGPVGVSGAFLRTFARKAFAGWEDMTTAEVCQKVVQPETSARKCAFIDLVGAQETDDEGRPLVGRATVFVSHAWGCPFKTTLVTMLEHAAEHPDAYFWFDLILNNQHDTAARPQEWWTTTFRTQIESIGSLLLVLPTWDRPAPLTRAWCLYELLCAAQGEGVVVRLRMPSFQSAQHFRQAMLDYKYGLSPARRPFDGGLAVLAATQAEKADATNEADKTMIFQAVRDTVGFARLDELVKEQMRSWYLETALDLVTSEERDGHFGKHDPQELSHMWRNFAHQLYTFGDYSRALEFFGKALAYELREGSGESSAEAAALHGSIARVHVATGAFDDARRHLERRTAIQEMVCDDGSPEVAETHCMLADCLREQGNDAAALVHYEKALAATCAGPGVGSLPLDDRHARAAAQRSALEGMSALCYRNKDHTRALALLDKSRAVAGLDDPSPTVASHSLAGAIYTDQGELGKAEEHLDAALASALATVGRKHANTAGAYENLARLAVAKDDTRLAKEYIGKAVASATASLGPGHPQTQRHEQFFNALADAESSP